MMQSILFYQLITCVLFIACSIFALDQSISKREIDFNSFMNLTSLLCSLIPTFLYCHFADGLTVNLFGIGNIFYSSMWYKLPSQKQKLLIPSIQRAQRIFRLNGYKIIDCSLEIFASVRFHSNISTIIIDFRFQVIYNFSFL